MNQQRRMMQQVQNMQAKMAKVQEDLENERVEASAGGGAVTAAVTGQKRLLSVTIDPDLAGDVDMLQDLVVAAVNEAARKVDEAMQDQLGAMTGGMKIPGLF